MANLLSINMEQALVDVKSAIADSLGDAYDCMRTWSAWGAGTMSSDDFVLVAEDDQRLTELAQSAISAMVSLTKVETSIESEIVRYQRETSYGWVEVNEEDIAHYMSMGQKIRPLFTTPQTLQAEPVAEVIEHRLADFMPKSAQVHWHQVDFEVGTKFFTEPQANKVAELELKLKAVSAIMKELEQHAKGDMLTIVQRGMTVIQ